jgi:hypothetical protein
MHAMTVEGLTRLPPTLTICSGSCSSRMPKIAVYLTYERNPIYPKALQTLPESSPKRPT